jgi:hypothetical protein
MNPEALIQRLQELTPMISEVKAIMEELTNMGMPPEQLLELIGGTPAAPVTPQGGPEGGMAQMPVAGNTGAPMGGMPPGLLA